MLTRTVVSKLLSHCAPLFCAHSPRSLHWGCSSRSDAITPTGPRRARGAKSPPGKSEAGATAGIRVIHAERRESEDHESFSRERSRRSRSRRSTRESPATSRGTSTISATASRKAMC